MSVVTAVIDGISISAKKGTSVLRAAQAAGLNLPYLCACEREGYKPIAACRTCLVEVGGRDELVPACRQPVEHDMVVYSESERAVQTRRVVVELLSSEMSAEAVHRHSESRFQKLISRVEADATRFGRRADTAEPDRRHPGIVVDSDACIRCGLCRSACQDVQVNSVIALAGHGDGIHVTFDTGKTMAESNCVTCGECAQVCPTGAIKQAALATDTPAKIDHSSETVCPFCSVGCRVNLNIANDRVVYAEGADGPANHGRLCVKGRFGFDYLRHPDRLTVPLIRRDDAPKDPSHNLHGADILKLFRPATWDEALDRAATGFRELRDSLGGDSLAVLGSAKGSNEDAYILQKAARTAFLTAHIDHCTRLCSSVPPLAEATGFSAVTIPIEQIAFADVALMVGSNPDVNHPVGASVIKNAVRHGTKLILVDPYQQSLSRLATHYLQLSPGTDVALLSAMTRVVTSEGLYDADFVRQRLEGFDELLERIEPYTPDVAAAVCGVSAETIVQAARLFAKASAAMCFWGMGASQHVHGADNIRAVIAFALVCGQVGRPGAGLHPLRGQNNVQGSCDAGLGPSYLPGYRPIVEEQRALFEGLWGTSLPEGPGLSTIEIMNAARARRVKGLYVVGGNPSMANPDLAATREALAKLDHLVVQDIFPTETAAFADVILPAAALAERSGTVTNTDRIVQLVEPVLPPPGQAREDWTITSSIAERLGVSSLGHTHESIFDEMASVVPVLNGLSWSKLKAERHVRYPIHPAEAMTDVSSGFDAGLQDSLFAEAFPCGKARISPLHGLQPIEPPDAEFPLILVTGRVREHWHTGSMTRRADVLDALAPEALVHVNSADFDRLGLSAEQMVSVETRRGVISARPVADEKLQAGVIWMAMSFVESAVNELTINKLDNYTRVPEYKFCSARIVSA